MLCFDLVCCAMVELTVNDETLSKRNVNLNNPLRLFHYEYFILFMH